MNKNKSSASVPLILFKVSAYMLSDEVKQTIQHAYKQILAEKSLRPRVGQRQMIAEIARSLSVIPAVSKTGRNDSGQDEHGAAIDLEADLRPAGPICVVEAGTGTGKTLAYVLGTLPLAKYLGKKVVLSTATVALQEQVTLKDLPDIKAYCDLGALDFSFTLAKGRGRYLCLSKLGLLMQGNASQNAMADLYGELLEAPDSNKLALYEDMLHKLNAGEWHGDRDDWENLILDSDWAPVTVEHGQCSGQKCSNYSNCCFYQARDEVQKADCIVANHDLVLADLALGGGVILPDPADTIYIFDEAHHLPLKSNQHFACFTRLRGSIQWLEQSAKTLSKLAADTVISNRSTIQREQVRINELLRALERVLSDSMPLFEQLAQTLAAPEGRRDARADSSPQFAFQLGVVPKEFRDLGADFNNRFGQLSTVLQDISNDLKREMEEGESLQARQHAEQWFPMVGGMASRAEANQKLWLHFARTDPAEDAPWARWLSLSDYGGVSDITLSCSPVLAAKTLSEKLWDVCAGAVLTSATLSALGQFDVLRMRAGLPAHSSYHRIISPFDYQNAASLVIPKLDCDPADTVRHTAAIVRLLPKLLDRSEAALMLFSSRRQMLEVLEGLDKEWREIILCQDDYQKAQLLKFHRQRIDKGEPSIIFGLASFAEGVDLPGKYCMHVLIAKIPFAVPNDPIEATLAQWLEQQGKNPFMTLSVPEAAFRLVQASGRLLRSETDTGRITLFDERVVSKRYGEAILNSLPPYRRDIFPPEPEPQTQTALV